MASRPLTIFSIFPIAKHTIDSNNNAQVDTTEITQEPNRGSMRNILLVGFMGSGKSTIGKILQRKTGFNHIDTDHVIEEKAQRPISQIFAQDGEDYFRDLETKLLSDLVADGCQETIISTGGGMVVREKNRELLRKLGFVVWLSCPPEEIYERTSRSGHRPLLQCDDPMGAIRDLLNQRKPAYADSAHLELSTSGLGFDEIACGIQESASYYFARHAQT